jgi:RNA polymerase sigma factor (sigma-70 family)
MFSQAPKLPCRGIKEKFYQYINVRSDKAYSTIQWKSETHLQRNLELYKSQHEKFIYLFNEQDNIRELVQFWIDIAVNKLPSQESWEPANRVQKAWEHLTVYCEESCYHAAFQVWKDDRTQSWEEFIFLARCLIYDHDKFRKVLSKYDCISSSLDTYITKVLINNIKDKACVSKFSKWRLFLHKSEKELKEALNRYGTYEPEASKYLFARKYFKQVYQMNKLQNPAQAKGQKYPEPDDADFEEIINYYNAEKSLTSTPHEVAAGECITVEQLKSWIETCVNALHNYPKSTIPRVSLESIQETEHEFLSNKEVSELNLFDDLTEIGIAKKTDKALKQRLLTLKVDQQKILLLYYGFGLNQVQIADKFQVTQGTIASRLRTIESKLLKTLSELSQPSQWISQYVNGWLVRNYQAPNYSYLIDTALVESIKQLNEKEKEALRLYYGQKIDKKVIEDKFNMPELDFTEFLVKIQVKLEIALMKEIEKYINKYIKLWLLKEYKSIIKSACNDLNVILQPQQQQIETFNAFLDKYLEKSLQIWQLRLQVGEKNV